MRDFRMKGGSRCCHGAMVDQVRASTRRNSLFTTITWVLLAIGFCEQGSSLQVQAFSPVRHPSESSSTSLGSQTSSKVHPLHHFRRRDGNLPGPLAIEHSVWGTAKDAQGLNIESSEYDYLIGSDESGTGAIAGPIVAASVCIQKNDDFGPGHPAWISGVQDSKRLPNIDRQRIYQEILQRQDYFHFSIVKRSSDEIDDMANELRDMNESQEQKSQSMDHLRRITMDAFCESIAEVAEKVVPFDRSPSTRIYSIVDGHRAPKSHDILRASSLHDHTILTCRPWKQADGTVYTVALASILAQVTRDRLIEESLILQQPVLASTEQTNYGAYGFSRHGGYSSTHHQQALQQYGPIPRVHRYSCRPVQQACHASDVRNAKSEPILQNTLKQTSTKKRMMARQDFAKSLAASLIVVTVGHTGSESANAMSVDPKTGSSLPDVGEIEAAIPKSWEGIENPLVVDAKSSSSSPLMGRLDSTPDTIFYQDPRFVEHVDEQAVHLMTDYISNTALNTGQKTPLDVLDLCSSWTSHIDKASVAKNGVQLGRVAGLGMNEKELQANAALTEYTLQDLNVPSPKGLALPYADNSFDVALCQLSIDYLTQPLQVCREIYRVLKPGGTIHIIFSNRLFLQKAVAIWTGADDVDHAFTVASYLHFSMDGMEKGFEKLQAKDLSVRKGRDKHIVGDPLYVVTATKDV